MTRAAQALLEEALQLPEADRDYMAESLRQSVPDAEFASDAEYEAYWSAELDRRRAEVRAGDARTIPHEEVMAMLRNRRRA